MSDWAKKAVGSMTDAEVAHWVKRFGLRPPTDERTPIERLVDEAVQAPKPKAKRQVRRKAGRR